MVKFMIEIENSGRLLFTITDFQRCQKILVTVPGFPDLGGCFSSLKEMPPPTEETPLVENNAGVQLLV